MKTITFFKRISRSLLSAILVLLCFTVLQAQTPVEKHWHLQVDGNKIKDKICEVEAFAGLSLFWSNNGIHDN